MLIEDFLPEFKLGVKNGDMKTANNAIMKQVGNYIVNKREDFVDLLNESGIKAKVTNTDAELLNAFVSNISQNKELAMGTSMLLHWNNGEYGMDGTTNSQSIKAGYNTLINYYDSERNSSFVLPQAIAGAVTEVSKLGNKLIEGQQKKKYGASDALQKQLDSKTAIAQQILAQRQAQIEQLAKKKEADAKTTKIIVLSVVGVVVVGIVGLVIYKLH